MLFVEDERIKLGGVVLPGLVKSIEVTETAKVVEQEVEGSASRPKQATGYEDAKINIELLIDDTETQTRFERYAVLRELFRTPGQTVPQPISIVCEDTAAHGIERVIFKKLTHKGENKRAQLTAVLELWEYIPQTITAVRSSSRSSGTGSSGSAGSKSAGSTSTAAASGNLSVNYQDYLADRGTSPTSVTGKKKAPLTVKRSRSPAVDDASAGRAMSKIKKMPY
jgi:hypothetical protein